MQARFLAGQIINPANVRSTENPVLQVQMQERQIGEQGLDRAAQMLQYFTQLNQHKRELQYQALERKIKPLQDAIQANLNTHGQDDVENDRRDAFDDQVVNLGFGLQGKRL